MDQSSVYRNLIELPTNFLSRESYKNGVRERDLLPPARFIKYPIKGAGLWGVHGGIEKLSMLAERIQPSSKITGFMSQKDNSRHQPCVITSITIPGNKLEDEKDLLPLIRRNIESASFPECLRSNLYTGHISKFEVFPRFDPEYSQYDDSNKRTLKQEIGPATQNALDRLSDELYRKSIYKTDFQPASPAKDISLSLPGIDHRKIGFDIQRPGILLEVLEATGCKAVPKEIEKERKMEKREKQELETQTREEEEEEVEETKEEGNDDVQPALGQVWGKHQSTDSALKNEARKAKAKANVLYVKRNASTVLPTCSPYQKNHIDKVSSSTNTILPQYLFSNLSKIPGQNPSFETKTKAESFSENLKRTKAIRRISFPTRLGEFEHARLPSFLTRSSNVNGTEEVSRDIRLPSLGAVIYNLPQHKNGDVQDNWRHKLPLMIGMRFKTAAHDKFHKDHPEPVPDLRDSINDGKKHVFYGAHAMLLR